MQSVWTWLDYRTVLEQQSALPEIESHTRRVLVLQFFKALGSRCNQVDVTDDVDDVKSST